MRSLLACTLGLALLLLVQPTRAETGDSPIVVSLRTTGGSCLTGLLEPNRQDPALVEGAHLLPWDQILAVSFSEDRSKAIITIRGEKTVEGRIVSKEVQITTVAGWLSVPWATIAAVELHPSKDVPEDLTQNPVLHRPVRFDITLRDSSCIAGVPDSSGARVHTEFGSVEIPWARVRSVVFHENHETSTFKLWNGDQLVGCVDWRAFSLATGLGSVHISPVHTESLAVSLGGIDLVEKPYVSATGTRHFLADVGNRQPRRIGGRIRPVSQFLTAHASGRIEFAFEQPVREFHAVLTMYESYCAHKGSVIFRLETDQGLVFTSRALRNLHREDVYVQFPPTRKLVLITDQNGSPDEDWSVWLHPEVR